VFLVGWFGLSAGKCSWWERESENKWAAETCVEILGIPLTSLEMHSLGERKLFLEGVEVPGTINA
jgi:hypothetical protein